MSNQLRRLNIFGEVRASDTTTRVREFVISTEALDRHGTVLRATGWDLSKFSGTAFYQHESMTNDPDMALGPARVWQEGTKTIGSIDFEEAELNPLADKILRKIDRGTLRNTSVGFIPKKIERGNKDKGEDPNKVYMDGELMEFSVVHIPSNHQAQLRKAEDELIELLASIEPKESTEPKPAHSTKRARVQFLSLQK